MTAPPFRIVLVCPTVRSVRLIEKRKSNKKKAKQKKKEEEEERSAADKTAGCLLHDFREVETSDCSVSLREITRPTI